MLRLLDGDDFFTKTSEAITEHARLAEVREKERQRHLLPSVGERIRGPRGFATVLAVGEETLTIKYDSEPEEMVGPLKDGLALWCERVLPGEPDREEEIDFG